MKYFLKYVNSSAFLALDYRPDTPISCDYTKIPDMEWREGIKSLADVMKNMGLEDGHVLLKDISHRVRYLSNPQNEPLDFFDYVDWKYSNVELDGINPKTY